MIVIFAASGIGSALSKLFFLSRNNYLKCLRGQIKRVFGHFKQKRSAFSLDKNDGQWNKVVSLHKIYCIRFALSLHKIGCTSAVKSM